MAGTCCEVELVARPASLILLRAELSAPVLTGFSCGPQPCFSGRLEDRSAEAVLLRAEDCVICSADSCWEDETVTAESSSECNAALDLRADDASVSGVTERRPVLLAGFGGDEAVVRAVVDGACSTSGPGSAGKLLVLNRLLCAVLASFSTLVSSTCGNSWPTLLLALT